MRRDSKLHELLKYLAFGSGVLVISLSPLGSTQLTQTVLRQYFRKKKFERVRFLQDLKNLQRREVIDYRELNDGRIEILLTAQGKEKMLRYHIDEIKLKLPRVWDKKWRLIMFDIPHAHRQARDAFRKKLHDLKFHPIQKSVFITPYPCEDEIDFIASIFDVRKYVLVLYVSSFEGEEKLKHHFSIS